LPGHFHACYTFAAPQDGFDGLGQSRGTPWSIAGFSNVLNSAGAGRRLALRVVAFQAVATLLTALACMTIGPRAALAALAGGGGMTLGSLAAAWGAFGGGVVGAGSALGRLLLGTAVKWLVVAVGLYLAMAVWRLPAVPVLAGAALAAAAFMFAVKRSTTRTTA
jgi:F0F1-type ATP synthase assembly protein I